MITRDEIMELAQGTAGWHWMDEAHIQRFASALIAAEREAICPIVYGHCGSDNDAQRIVDAIRARREK